MTEEVFTSHHISLTQLKILILAVGPFLAQAQDADTVPIVGQVQLAGQFKVKAPISLLDAIKLARGFTACESARD